MRPSEIFLREEVNQREEKNSRRSLKLPQGIDFYSNDYLGYARSPQIIGTYQQKIQDLSQLGATGSRLLGGQHFLHHVMEEKISELFQSEEALLFSSGYLANLGLIQCLGMNRTIIMDELSHNSMRNGAKLSGSKTLLFRHNDLDHLEKRLKDNLGSIILVEAVYSMDGDLSPLKGIVTLARKYQAEVVVDEAHAVGVLGPLGRGLVVQENLESEILARVVTFGKAFGAEGAAVLGSSALKNFLINFCQSFIYTTGVSLPNLLMLESALEHFSASPVEINALQDNVRSFSQGIGQELMSPIFSWSTPGSTMARAQAAHLQGQGFTAYPVLAPTVRQGSERIRIVLHAFNKREDILNLAQIVRQHE